MEGPGKHPGKAKRETPLPPRAQRLVERVRDLCETTLQPLLKQTLDDFDQQMFQLADQSGNNTEQEICLASQREVRRGRSDLSPRFLSLLSAGFTRYHLGEDAAARSIQDGQQRLSLLEPHEQEEEVALDATEARVELRSGIPLLELGYRFAALAGIPVVESDVLPIGPHAICTAWQRASNELDLPPAHRQLLHQLFGRYLLRDAPRMYEALNTLMAAQGLLPDLRTLMVRRARAGISDSSQKNDAQQASTGTPEATQEQGGTPASAAAPEEGSAAQPRPSDGQTTAAFDVLRGLLARRRHALGLEETTPQPTGPTSDPDQLQAVLANLQKQSDTTVLEDGVRHVRNMKHLRQDMQAQLRGMSPDGQPLAFTEQQTDTIELMTLLFDHLGRDMPIDGHAATLMSRLQAPMLRVALDQPEFFSEKEHPARQLLGSVLDTAMQWLDGAGEDADPVLARKLQNVVDRTVEEFDGDVDLLDELRQDLDSQLSVLRRRAEISERRHLEAAQGRERLQLARNRASQLVAERLQDTDASGLLRTMMEQAWTDVLALSMLRWGERSKAFRHRLEVTDRMLRHKVEQDDPELREEISEGLGQVGIHGEEAEQIARHVVARGKVPEAGEAEESGQEQLTRTELAMRLKQRQRLGSGDGAESEAAGKSEAKTATPAEPEPSPAEQEALERLRQLRYGTWLEFIRPDERVVRRKLAWFSPVTGHCLVVSQRGAREDVSNLRDLGKMMAAGTVRIPEERGESLLDRAWNAIVKGLQQFAKVTQEQSA